MVSVNLGASGRMGVHSLRLHRAIDAELIGGMRLSSLIVTDAGELVGKKD